MRIRTFRIINSFLILCIFILIVDVIGVYSSERPSKNTVQIPLIYPQESNSPKREAKKIEKAPVLNGEVFIDVVGIKPEQLKTLNLYVEYFLDNELIYSTENKQRRTPRPKSLRFILDTCVYPEGEHTLVVNLWNKDGPSAIGIRKIIIQNQRQNNEN